MTLIKSFLLPANPLMRNVFITLRLVSSIRYFQNAFFSVWDFHILSIPIGISLVQMSIFRVEANARIYPRIYCLKGKRRKRELLLRKSNKQLKARQQSENVLRYSNSFIREIIGTVTDMNKHLNPTRKNKNRSFTKYVVAAEMKKSITALRVNLLSYTCTLVYSLHPKCLTIPNQFTIVYNILSRDIRLISRSVLCQSNGVIKWYEWQVTQA